MKDLDFNSIGVRIKSLRKRKNLTQDQLAEIIGSDRTVVARIENGNQGCSIDYLVKIANALETSSDSLLIDSLEYPGMDTDEAEISELLLDCTAEEISILIRTLNTLRDILKEYTIK